MPPRRRPTEKRWAKSSKELEYGPSRHREDGRNVLRTLIAQSAARLIAEGLTNIYEAKQKAARRLGISDAQALPGCDEIETALREHFALFDRENQRRELQALRNTAMRAMLCLEHFSPWLTGTVLSGTANRFSTIEIELIDVEPKHFEMYLFNARIEYELCDSRSHKQPKSADGELEIVYRLEFEHTSIMITLYETHLARQTRHPRGSLKHDRAQREEAETRFAAQITGS